MERSAISDWRSKRVAVVTGGNKGIGLEVCRQLAGNGVAVVLTARDKARGEAAVEKLRGDGLSSVIFHQLEVTDARSVARLADFLKAHVGKLDFAGMDEGQMSERMQRNTRETYNSAKETLETNYYGTKHVTQALLLLLHSSTDGRIVNVSSVIGQLRYFVSEELKQELNDVGKLSKQRLDEMVAAFMEDFTAGTVGARGWPVGFSAYKVAKAAVNAYTRVLARRHPELRVNCVHPGFVKPT
nr:unnamed protein product [Digitaria exilis]